MSAAQPRILHVIPSLERAGAQKQLTLLAGGLALRQFDVHVAALTRGGPCLAELAQSGVSASVIGKRLKLDPFAYTRLESLVRRLRPDLIHTWMFAANAYGRAAALRCGVRRIVAAERCVDPWKSKLQLSLDRRLAARTDAIVTNSAAVRDFYALKGLPRQKFVVIANGVEASPNSPRTASTLELARRAIVAELRLPAASRFVIAVGGLRPQKRLKDAIWAADLLKVARDDIHLLIVGDGPQRRRLEMFRDQVQIADCVHLLGERSDVPRLLSGCEALLLASGYEGQSNAIMEAMAAGLPVVASDLPTNRELVLPGETGLLFPVGDRAALARGVNKLLSDSALAERLGAAGRTRMSAQFTVAAMVDRYVDLYRRLLSTE